MTDIETIQRLHQAEIDRLRAELAELEAHNRRLADHRDQLLMQLRQLELLPCEPTN